MGVPTVAGDTGTAGIQVLIRRCAYRDAVLEAERALGVDLGRFCQAMLGEHEGVQGVVEEVLLAFHDAAPGLEREPLRPWLFGVAYQLCTARLREMDADARAQALQLQRSDDGRLPPEGETARRRARQIRATLETLGLKPRTVALLRYTARLSYAEIATICGISEDEAVKHAGRALLGLRDGLADAGGEDAP